MAGFKVICFTLAITMMMLETQGWPSALPSDFQWALPSDVKEIEMQARRYEEYYRVGNYSGVQSLYTEDCRLFLIGFPEIRGPDFLARSLPGLKASGVETLQLVTTEIFRMGRYYYRSGVNTFFNADGTTINILNFVTIFRKDNGTWMYFVDMINTQNANPQGNTQNSTDTQ